AGDPEPRHGGGAARDGAPERGRGRGGCGRADRDRDRPGGRAAPLPRRAARSTSRRARLDVPARGGAFAPARRRHVGVRGVGLSAPDPGRTSGAQPEGTELRRGQRHGRGRRARGRGRPCGSDLAGRSAGGARGAGGGEASRGIPRRAGRMIRVVAGLARAGLAFCLFLLVAAALRNGPVYARPPWSIPALPVAGAAVVLAASCAVGSRPRPVGPVRPLLIGMGATVLALAAVVAVRPPAGLPLDVRDGERLGARFPPGPVDVVGRDLKDLPSIRRWSLRWEGPLRVPETGTYRLSAEGRGRVRVTLDGAVVLEADGDPLEAGRDVPIGRGTRALEVML